MAYLAVDEFDVFGALSVTVTSSVFGTSLVVGEARHTTILVHGDEVESTVETAREVAHVNVKGKLLVLELEHLVVSVVLHEVDTGPDVLGVWALGDEP